MSHSTVRTGDAEGGDYGSFRPLGDCSLECAALACSLDDLSAGFVGPDVCRRAIPTQPRSDQDDGPNRAMGDSGACHRWLPRIRPGVVAHARRRNRSWRVLRFLDSRSRLRAALGLERTRDLLHTDPMHPDPVDWTDTGVRADDAVCDRRRLGKARICAAAPNGP